MKLMGKSEDSCCTHRLKFRTDPTRLLARERYRDSRDSRQDFIFHGDAVASGGCMSLPSEKYG